jgi:ribosome maturation factor RimP
MSAELILQKTEKWVAELLSAEPEYFLIEVKVKPTNNIKVYIDGDKGISIEKCVYFNRLLYKKIDETGMFPEGDFSLEVSSPGLDKPLKLHRQYLKNIGRNIEVTFNDGSKKEGKLLQATNEDIILEQISGKGKKTETQQLVIPFSNIKTITVQIQF